jgi:hypothetical protein
MLIAKSYYLAIFTEAYGKAGQARKELRVLTDALAVVNNKGERRWDAELY